MTAVLLAWYLLAFVVIGLAARVALADLRSRARGERSWGEHCLDERLDGECGCVPTQREGR